MGRIVVDSLFKRYRYRGHGSSSKTRNAVLEAGLRSKDEFWALRDVSLEVAPGQMVGIVGANGAGKSTLLRMVGGVGRPSAGRVRVTGRMGALLELGSDFHHELTGRENAVIGGIVAGLTRREVLARMDSIVDFAELDDFIDSPVRAYSAGMMLRLAFAIAVHTDPEVLLIDEVLAVGDAAFRRKCIDRIAQFRRDGCAILLVTHEAQIAVQLCDSAVWLSKGAVMQAGPAEAVVLEYLASTAAETRRRTPLDWPTRVTADGAELQMFATRFGSMELEVTDVRLLDSTGFRCRQLRRGESLRVEIDYRTEQVLASPIFSVQIRQESGAVLFDGSIQGQQLGMDTVRGPGSVAVTFERLDLNNGLYHVDVGVYRQDWAYAYDYHWHVYDLNVLSIGPGKGVVNPPHNWERSRPRAAGA